MTAAPPTRANCPCPDMPEPCIAPEPWAIHTAPTAQQTTPMIPRIHTAVSDLLHQHRAGHQLRKLNTDFELQQIAVAGGAVNIGFVGFHAVLAGLAVYGRPSGAPQCAARTGPRRIRCQVPIAMVAAPHTTKPNKATSLTIPRTLSAMLSPLQGFVPAT